MILVIDGNASKRDFVRITDVMGLNDILIYL